MAKKQIRTVEASADLRPLIDRGYQVDTEVKNLGSEDKAIKAKITANAGLQGDENSVKLAGDKAVATVTKRTSYGISDGAVADADFAAGKYGAAVVRNIKVDVPRGVTAAQVAEAVKALGGVIEVTYGADEVDDAAKALLGAALTAKETLAVKYEAKS